MSVRSQACRYSAFRSQDILVTLHFSTLAFLVWATGLRLLQFRQIRGSATEGEMLTNSIVG